MNESSDKKVDTSYKKCSRGKLPFVSPGSYSYYAGGAFDGDFFTGEDGINFFGQDFLSDFFLAGADYGFILG